MEDGRLNILVVDDAEIVVQRLFEILNEIDCLSSIFNAGSFDQAVNIIKENKLDIILLDIQMPGKNGIELLAFIRKKYPKIITIMLTNRVSDFYKELCKNMGANYFIDKSSEFENIPRIIKSLIPKAKKILIPEKPL